MLPDSDAVRAVYLDPQSGILAGVSAVETLAPSPSGKKIVMECGTIENDTILSVARDFQDRVSNRGEVITFVDAPVSGGPMGAQAGTLTFMVGCPPSLSSRIFPTVTSYLRHMGNEDGIFLCGDIGAGTAFKIINNYRQMINWLFQTFGNHKVF